MIFVLTQADISPWTNEFRKWIYCTHVSRRWRRVSLAFNHLWTSIDTTWGSIVTTFIHRSGNAPLILRMDLRPDTWWLESQAINMALTHISRTRELYLRVEGVEELTKISTQLLQIGLQTSLEVLDFQSGVSSFELPRDIFKQTHGSLRSLTFTNVCSPYPPALLGNITSLRIIWTQRPGSPHLVSFLDMLDQCSNIVEFEFCDKMSWDPLQMDPGRWPWQRMICLRHLRRLSLTNPPSPSVIHLLNHLSLPALHSLKISCCANDYWGIPSIQPAFTSAYDSCRVEMSKNDLHVVFTHIANPDLIMDVRLRILQNDFDAFRSVFPDGFPLLTSLCFSFSFPTVPSEPYQTTTWISLLQSLPNLHDLKFGDLYGNGTCDQTAATLLNALSSEPNTSGHICPKLRSVSFANISLSPDVPMKEVDSTNARISATGIKLGHRSVINFNYSLWAFVISRSRQRMRLAQLDISECQHVDDPLLESLAPYVDEILPKPHQSSSAIGKVVNQ
ncbi:hypothetical protein BD410DRAFT_85990 [Rickenella mellea]|uniref:F-box domain-containing protein n=1 Tax=Rickenella mellea TaxID=50990 RepID=A0A4Y7PMU9_9AGAM|nr:hypothetical protein BD410DRAFT_85990 [Rickenella mellea]